MEAELAEQEVLLPEMKVDQALDCKALDAKSHTTQPPARYTEASLTRTLEERGIGRPSTFASIIDTIQNRDYVFKKGNALVPSWTAFSVIRLLVDHLGSLVDYDFTAQMEDYLDQISRNEQGFKEYLHEFYYGDANLANDEGLPGKRIGLKPLLEAKVTEIDPRLAGRFSLGSPEEGDFHEEVFVRVGPSGRLLSREIAARVFLI